MNEHSTKFNELYNKAKSQGFLSIDDLNLNYADSDKERIELCDLLRSENIEITFNYSIDDDFKMKESKKKKDNKETKTVRRSVKKTLNEESDFIDASKIKEDNADNKKDYLPNGPDEDVIEEKKEAKSLKDVLNKKKKIEDDDIDDLDEDDNEDEDLDDNYYDDDDDLDDEIDEDDELDEEDKEDLSDDNLDELNDEEFYNSEDDQEALKYEYDNFDDWMNRAVRCPVHLPAHSANKPPPQTT